MAKKRVIRLESAELAWLCDQIALVQKSGIPLPEGMSLLADSSDMPRMTTVLKLLATEMGKMIPLSDAMDKLDAFPPYLVQMARIGEISGNLDQIMASLADFYTRDAQLRKKVRSSLVYPLVLLIMMLAVIIMLIVRVLPVFSEILASFGGQMPPFSQRLLQLGQFLSTHFYWLLPLILAIIAALLIWLGKTGAGRRFTDRAKLSLPLLSPLYKRIYASRLSVSLAYLMRSAVDFDTALAMAEAVMDNSIVAARVKESRKAIADGKETFLALEETKLFPRLFIRMLSLGSKTGDLDQVMLKIATSYEQEVDHRLTRLTAIVEPLLVVILSLIVGAILLTVMLPLVEIMASIG